MAEESVYVRIIKHVFFKHFQEGADEVPFVRADIESAPQELGVERPRNLGDTVYSFRFRRALPEAIRAKAPTGRHWVIRLVGDGKYRFSAVEQSEFLPNKMLTATKVPDATPGVISMYALSDEQALLAKLRYNRLIDIFTRVACYSLQSHLRTKLPDLGQVETDEIYVGIDRTGAHYVLPVQAKAGRDKLGIVQIEQDFSLCAHKFPSLVCRPIGTQFLDANTIALFEFEMAGGEVRIRSEKHYVLVPPDEMSQEDIDLYRQRTDDED